MGLPTEGDLYGNGVLVLVVGVTSHQGAWESQAQGEGAQVTAMNSYHEVCECRTPKRY